MIAKTTLAVAAVIAAAAVVGSAQAKTLTRTGPNGGTATVDWTAGNGSANGTVSLAGPNGGTGSGQLTCTRGVYRAGCAGSWTATNAAGQTWSGVGAVGAGPHRAGHVGVVAGPNGARYTHRVWWR